MPIKSNIAASILAALALTGDPFDAEQALNAEPRARIFISYSRKDMAFADRLDAALKALLTAA